MGEKRKCPGLHDVRRAGVVEAAVEHGDGLVQGVLDRVADAVAVPQADKAGLRVHVGVQNRGVKVEFHGYCGKVYRVVDADVVRRKGRACTFVRERYR